MKVEERIDLCLTDDGVVIGDRQDRTAVAMSYGDMIRIVQEFLHNLRLYPLLTEGHREVEFISLKEGDGSPYPVVGITKPEGRTIQLKASEILGVNRGDE